MNNSIMEMHKQLVLLICNVSIYNALSYVNRHKQMYIQFIKLFLLQLTIVEFQSSEFDLEACHMTAVIAVIGLKRHKEAVAA